MAFGETLFTENTFENEGHPTLYDEKMLAMVALSNSGDVDLN